MEQHNFLPPSERLTEAEARHRSMRLIQAEALLAAASGAALPSHDEMQLFQLYVDGHISWPEALFHWRALQSGARAAAHLPGPELHRYAWAER